MLNTVFTAASCTSDVGLLNNKMSASLVTVSRQLNGHTYEHVLEEPRLENVCGMRRQQTALILLRTQLFILNIIQ